MKRHLELEIKTLENAPTDADKLRQLLKVKQRKKKEEEMNTEDTERLVTEIEMLKVVLYLVSRKKIPVLLANKNYNRINLFPSAMSAEGRKDMLRKLEKNVERAAEVYANTPPALYLTVLAIPEIGPFIDTLFRHKASEILHRRYTELWEATKAEVNRIDMDKIDKSLFL
jgi:hypothetical protein